jgi:hypothetical protein
MHLSLPVQANWELENWLTGQLKVNPGEPHYSRSKSRNLFKISGNLVAAATIRSHSRLSIAGYPLTTAPAATSPGIPVCAVATAPSPTVKWSRNTHLPSQNHILANHGRTQPAQPVHRAGYSRPHGRSMPHLHQVIDLRSRASIRVSPIDARSTQAFACTSTESSSTAGPDCTIFTHPSAPFANPNPSAPITAPFWSTTSSPSTAVLSNHCMSMCKKAIPYRNSRDKEQHAAVTPHHPRSTHPSLTTTYGPNVRPSPKLRARRSITAVACTPSAYFGA